LDSVDWRIVFAVMGAKAIVVLLGIGLAWLTTRKADGTGFRYTLGGVNALLSTMSDDMGIGLPILIAFAAGPLAAASRLLSTALRHRLDTRSDCTACSHTHAPAAAAPARPERSCVRPPVGYR
jgi:hypothetical protein